MNFYKCILLLHLCMFSNIALTGQSASFDLLAGGSNYYAHFPEGSYFGRGEMNKEIRPFVHLGLKALARSGFGFKVGIKNNSTIVESDSLNVDPVGDHTVWSTVSGNISSIQFPAQLIKRFDFGPIDFDFGAGIMLGFLTDYNIEEKLMHNRFNDELPIATIDRPSFQFGWIADVEVSYLLSNHIAVGIIFHIQALQSESRIGRQTTGSFPYTTDSNVRGWGLGILLSYRICAE